MNFSTENYSVQLEKFVIQPQKFLEGLIWVCHYFSVFEEFSELELPEASGVDVSGVGVISSPAAGCCSCGVEFSGSCVSGLSCDSKWYGEPS